MSQVVYLYGFVPADAALPPQGLAGIDAQPVELLPLDDLAAAVSRLPAAEYRADAIEQHLADLPWVAERGVQHERVVAWFVDHAQILPVRLLTLYSDDTALSDEARQRADLLRAEMERFRGLREWDLKVSYQAATLQDHLAEVSSEIAELDAEIADAAPGRRFLLQKKRDDAAHVEIVRAARRVAEELLGDVTPQTREVKRVPIPRDTAELPVVLNAALLVPLDAEAALRDIVARRTAALEPVGVHVIFSGPWAPYRFLAGEHGSRPAAPTA